jgi:hypothetical protein
MDVETLGDLLAAVRVGLLAGRSTSAMRILQSATSRRGWTICRLATQRHDTSLEHSVAAQLGMIRRLIAIGEHAAAIDVIATATVADVVRTPPLSFAIHASPTRELRATILDRLQREADAWPP